MKKWWHAIPLCLLLAGCWDQRPIKDRNLIFGVGIDNVEENKISLTVEVPQENAGNTGGGGGAENQAQPPQESQILSDKGRTIRESAYKLDRRIGGALDVSKLRILMIGKESAEKDMYALLDAYFRNPLSPLNAKLVVIDGKADEFFQKEFKGETLYSEYFFELIKTAEKESVTPKTNLQLACNLLLDQGSDAIIPLLSYNDEQQAAEMSGTALFNGRSMTGTLTPEETSAFLIMANQTEKELPLTFQVKEKEEITVLVADSKAKMKVNMPEKGNPNADISVEMDVRVIEYPPDHLDDKKLIEELNHQLSQEAERLLNRTIKEMQKANSDVLGIGRRMIAKDPDKFKEMEWGELYPTLEVKVEAKVNITRSGVIL